MVFICEYGIYAHTFNLPSASTAIVAFACRFSGYGTKYETDNSTAMIYYNSETADMIEEKVADEKLNAILKYTRDTFKRFDLDETEIFQICECVRYFVTNKRVLSMTEIHIKKHSSITQISLKNFAWNIAFQYNIGGDMTTSFVMATFTEWFANSTFDTVRKNLRTTTGRHKIEIDENILSKYGI